MSISNGCIKVTSEYVGKPLSLKCEKLGDSLHLNTTYLGSNFNIITQCKNVRLKVSCGVICSLNKDTENYLYVKEGLFILSDGKKFELR